MACNLEKRTPAGARRGIAILRTAFWYQRLTWRTQKLTPYAVGKHLQPDTYRTSGAGDRYSHNLWPKYARGAVVPSRSLLEQVDRAVPGSRADFEHIVFEVMDPAPTVATKGDALLKRMHAGVQLAVFENSALRQGSYRRQVSLARTLDRLERQGHLDALAAAIVLLKEAHAKNEHEHAFQIGLAVYRILLITCSVGFGTLMAPELCLAIFHLVLPLAASRGRAFSQDTAVFSRQCASLSHTICALEDNERIDVDPAAALQAAVKIIRGGFGDDLRCGLLPRLEFAGEPECIPVSSREEVIRHRVLGDWGREVLGQLRVERFIPVAVLNDLRASLASINEGGETGSAPSAPQATPAPQSNTSRCAQR